MSQPGWYPDPAGQPGQFRHWDGQQWSAQTSTTPSGPRPGDTDGNRGGWWIGIGVLVLVLAVVAGGVFLRSRSHDSVTEDTNSSTPTVSSWDETSKPKDPPTSPPDDGGGDLVACPKGDPTNLSSGEEKNGRLYGGGISVPSLGWNFESYQTDWINQTASQQLYITDTWVSTNAVGQVRKADGFTNPARAADVAMQCLASSRFYVGRTGQKTVVNEQVTVAGRPAHHIKAEIYVSNQGPDIPGDVVDVLVLDLGDPDTLSIYFSTATIGDTKVIADVERARADLRVG